jgi:hypothetical protein
MVITSSHLVVVALAALVAGGEATVGNQAAFAHDGNYIQMLNRSRPPERVQVNAERGGDFGSVTGELPSVADLPPGTVKVSPPIPGMGEHWAKPSDLPLGPIYCVMGGKVICAEFMIERQAFVDGKSFERLSLGMKGKLPAVNHLEVTFMPHGHEGYEVPHYDLHMYFIPPEARYPNQAVR